MTVTVTLIISQLLRAKTTAAQTELMLVKVMQ